MAIVTELTITVSGNKATINNPVYFYLGDGDCTLLMRINKMNTKIGTFRATDNIVEEFGAQWARVCILSPEYKNDKGNTEPGIVTTYDKCEIIDGAVAFTVTRRLMDELKEIGQYALQIHLYDDGVDVGGNRFTIPPIFFTIEKPICELGHVVIDGNSATAGGSHTNAGTVAPSDTPSEVFDENGIYIMNGWASGDEITAARLNKMETGIWWNSYYGNLVVENVEELNEIDTSYLVEGVRCFVKDQAKLYFYTNGGWVVTPALISSDLPNEIPKYKDIIGYLEEEDLSDINVSVFINDADYTTKTELQNEINDTKTELQNEINDTKTELQNEFQTHAMYAESTYATKESLNETNNNLTALDSKIDNHTTYAEETYAKKTEIPTKVSQLENDKNYVTEEELESKEYLSKYQDITILKDAVNIMLSKNTQQYLVLGEENVDITLPDLNEAEEVYEIHLYIAIGDSEPPIVTFNRVTQWTHLPELKTNTTYEFIFTWLGSRGYWLGGYIEYSEII